MRSKQGGISGTIEADCCDARVDFVPDGGFLCPRFLGIEIGARECSVLLRCEARGGTRA